MSKASEAHAARIARHEAEERAKSLSYISDPMQWVKLLCPLKRRDPKGGPPECAYMIGDGPNIYRGNMWSASKDDPKETFIDYAAIIDAGWVVD